MDAVPIYNVNPMGSTAAGDGFFGNNGLMILGAFLIFGLLFNGGFGGLGGNRGTTASTAGADTLANLMTSSAVATARNEAGLQFLGTNAAAQGVKLDTIIQGQYNANTALSSAICSASYENLRNFNSLSAQSAACCCETQKSILALGNNIAQQLATMNYNNAMQTVDIKNALCDLSKQMAANQLQDTRDALADAKLKLALAEQAAANCGC